MISEYSGKDNQLWKIEQTYHGLYKIVNKQLSNLFLSVNNIAENENVFLLDSNKDLTFGWNLLEVCEQKQEAFKKHTIPCTIEAEDFDTGCPGDAYYDKNDANEGGEYRIKEGVDIEKCSAGGYNVGWISKGEFLSYTVTVNKSATYQISFYVASPFDNGNLHLECDGENITGIISIPNTSGFQKWDVIKKILKLDAGEHIIKLVFDSDNFNVDKMVFEKIE